MKKFLATGFLAICAIALSQQQASAWISTSIGGSFTLGFQTGGHTHHHGIWSNGQPPAPIPQGHYYQHSYYHGADHAYYVPSYGSMPQTYGSFGMQMIEPSYAQPMMQYATSPDPAYYYYGR